MSIYATRRVLSLPRYGDFHTGCDWITIFVQEVPEHCGPSEEGATDPYGDFLPNYASSIAGGVRAVAIVREDDIGDGLRYSNPLLILSGKEYFAAAFEDLLGMICDRLRSTRPRIAAEWQLEDGSTRVLFEDGSSIVVPSPPSQDEQ